MSRLVGSVAVILGSNILNNYMVANYVMWQIMAGRSHMLAAWSCAKGGVTMSYEMTNVVQLELNVHGTVDAALGSNAREWQCDRLRLEPESL